MTQRIVCDTSLYDAVREYSRGSTRCWIMSPYIGRDAHNVLDRTFLAAKKRRVLTDIGSGCIDRTELMRLRQWAKDDVRSLPGLHAKAYIFDDACIVTSANLTLDGFRHNREVGVVLTGNDAAALRTIFSRYWNDDATRAVTARQIKALPPAVKWGRSGGRRDGTHDLHTDIDFWDTPSPDETQRADKNTDTDVNAAPTADCTEYVSEALERKTKAELKSRGIKGAFFISEYGVRKTRSLYGEGYIFDASSISGAKKQTWAIDQWRELGRVLTVFKVGPHVVVAYRVSRHYKVDSIIYRHAQRLKVHAGRPDAFQLLEYTESVKRREALRRRRLRARR